MCSSILSMPRIPGFRQRIIPEPHVPSRGSQARGTRLVHGVLSFSLDTSDFHAIIVFFCQIFESGKYSNSNIILSNNFKQATAGENTLIP